MKLQIWLLVTILSPILFALLVYFLRSKGIGLVSAWLFSTPILAIPLVLFLFGLPSEINFGEPPTTEGGLVGQALSSMGTEITLIWPSACAPTTMTDTVVASTNAKTASTSTAKTNPSTRSGRASWPENGTTITISTPARHAPDFSRTNSTGPGRSSGFGTSSALSPRTGTTRRNFYANTTRLIGIS